MPTLNRNIVISLALAMAAAAALFFYTSSVRTGAEKDSSTVSVVVASHEIPAGTSIDDAESKGWLATEPVRQASLADNAVTDIASARGEVVTQTLYPGDQLTPYRLGDTGAQTLSGKVTGNFRSIRVPFNPNSGLLNDIQPGDHVDVITSYRKGDTVYTQLAVPNAQVLSVQAPDETGVGNGGNGSIALEVTEEQAMVIANALASSDSGGASNNIWLAVAGSTGATYEPIKPFSFPPEQ
jgi:Flp pilus assembly protein CpaB